MKKLLLIQSIFFIALTSYAQSPEKFSYQAVIRNADGKVLNQQNVAMQISIIQNSVNGGAVYSETHRSNTNANGLLSIIIGEGEVVSGDFSVIDWSEGPYFIKSETDPQGGSNYTIVSTSQLLSVPYALHANTADELTFNVVTEESDPIFQSSLASGITEVDTAFWNTHTEDTKLTSDEIAEFGFVTGSHTDSTDIANYGYVAGPQLDSTSIANMGFVTNATDNIYEVGDLAQGGVVFWVDATGRHGLVCAISDQSAGIRWHAGTKGSTQAKGDGIYAGKSNTAIAISSHVAIGDDGETYAARICNELVVTENGVDYGDWYLPSMVELGIMYNNKNLINSSAVSAGGNAFASDFYWSSTEINANNAEAMQFNAGVQLGFGKQVPRNVRAIRSF